MPSELSQAERTAWMEVWTSWRPVQVPSNQEVHLHGWAASRDYGRERERALTVALETADRRIKQMHEADDPGRREIAIDAICEIDDARVGDWERV